MKAILKLCTANISIMFSQMKKPYSKNIFLSLICLITVGYKMFSDVDVVAPELHIEDVMTFNTALNQL